MNGEPGAPTVAAERFLPPARSPRTGPLLHVPLHLSDRPLVGPGQRVEPGQPLVERYREQDVQQVTTDAALLSLPPGEAIDAGLVTGGGRRSRAVTRPGERARIVAHVRDGRTFVAVGRGDITVYSPASGVVETVLGGRIDLRADGLGLPGRIAWGRAVHGPLLIAGAGPDAELRASAIDVGAAGAVLVVGARLDIEALTRARAIGVAGVVSGGIVGRELQQIEESEMRQRAALHPAAPFGLIALEGYGRRAIPLHVWDMLVAAAGRGAGIAIDDQLLVIEGDPGPVIEAGRRPSGTVAITAGDHAGQEGRLTGLTGPRRWPGGVYAPGAFVELVGPSGILERTCLPLSDLERLG